MICMKNKSCTLLATLCLSLSSIHVLAQVNGPQAVAGEYIVKMKSHSGESVNNRLSVGMKLVGKMGSSIKIKQAFWGSAAMHIKADNPTTIEVLKANPEVEYVEPNYLLSVNPVDIQPFGVAPQNTDVYDQSNSKVEVTEAWAIQKPYNQGTKTVVAVIDTGLAYNHGLFTGANAVWKNTAELNGQAGVDDDNNGYIDDIQGWNYVANSNDPLDDDDHGTHVSGIILGVGQDVLALPVRESKVQIMPLKFLDANGSGSTANAVNAIYYAVNMGARVINNSWGGSSYSRSLHDAYTYAYNHGVVIVSAAGNANSNNDLTPMYPANLDTPNNISVGASTDSDKKASFSNFGSNVHVAAPGVAIISTVPGTGCANPGCYQMMSGTSMAAPFVAGLAALVLREAPQLSPYQVRNVIMSSVDNISAFSGKVSTSGRVNALNTIQTAISQANVAAYSPSYSPVYKTDRSVASEEAAAPAAGCGLVKAVMDSSGGGPTAGQAVQSVIVMVMVLMPLALALGFRNRARAQNLSGIQRRKYARYNLAKNMTVHIGDQIVNAETDTVSLGGISFSSEMKVAKGDKITLRIGDMDQDVEGEIVWCSQEQSYGVRFLNITEQFKMQMNSWTSGLNPT
jgi:thermitase